MHDARRGVESRSSAAIRHTYSAAVALVVLTIAPGCRGAAIDANEARAISSVRAVISGQIVYATNCSFSYAPTLPALAAKGLIGADLGATAEPTQHGYRLTMTAVKGDFVSECGPAYKDFEIRAEPTSPGQSGRRYFRATSDGNVYAATKPDFSDASLLQ